MIPSALLVVAAAALAAGPASPPSVLLVTVDTLRPDALGWVAARNRTPAFDQLALAGYRFPAAVSPAPVTLPAHTSVLTGLLPRRHGARDNGLVVPATVPLLTEALRGRGYATAAFVSGLPLTRAFGLDRGFALYDDRLPDGPAELRERRAAATASAFAAWLATAPEPWFAWVHFYDPHDPYDPPPALRRSGPRGDYDGEVAAVDEALGALRSALARRTRGRLLTVLAGDHGESLGEHGEATHGFFVYESTVAVPLVFHLPGAVVAQESRAPARLVDVAPTVLELVGAPPLSGIDGVSLVPLLSGRAQSLPPALIETERPWRSYGWAPLRALRVGDLKLVEAPRPELYDLRLDPGEQHDLAPTERPALERLRGLLARAEAGPAASAGARADPELAERLRALGYVGASRPADEAPPAGLADPKDRLAEWNLLGEAEAALTRRDFEGALARFERVLAHDPGNRFALSRSGTALLELGRGEAALERMRRAVGAGPEHAEARLDLARAAARLGRHDLALAQWRELAAQHPREPAYWVGLAAELGRTGQAAGAVTALEQARRMAPEDPDLRVRLAFAQYAVGRRAEAAELLLGVGAAAGPERFQHSAALGLLLAGLGRGDEARRWLQAARREQADFADARVQLARLELERGQSEAARQALMEALAAQPALRTKLAGDAQLATLLR